MEMVLKLGNPRQTGYLGKDYLNERGPLVSDSILQPGRSKKEDDDGKSGLFMPTIYQSAWHPVAGGSKGLGTKFTNKGRRELFDNVINVHAHAADSLFLQPQHSRYFLYGTLSSLEMGLTL